MAAKNTRSRRQKPQPVMDPSSWGVVLLDQTPPRFARELSTSRKEARRAGAKLRLSGHKTRVCRVVVVESGRG